MTLDTTGHQLHGLLAHWKAGYWEIGEVMSVTQLWILKVDEAYEKHTKREADLKRVNGFLLDVRKAFWD